MLRKVLLLALPLIAVGCAGNDAFHGTTPFVGAWSDNWVSPGSADTGVLTLTIGADAVAIGSFTNSSTSEVGTFKGSVHTDGGFRGDVAITGSSKRIHIQGKMERVAAHGNFPDGIAGDATMNDGSGPKPFVFDPIPASPGSAKATSKS